MLSERKVSEEEENTESQSIERQDVGLELNLVPTILSDSTVALTVEVNANSLSESTQATDLITNTRSIKTETILQHDQVLYLGGLVNNDQKTTKKSVPILGKIPLLGKAFQYKKDVKSISELSVFLKVKII